MPVLWEDQTHAPIEDFDGNLTCQRCGKELDDDDKDEMCDGEFSPQYPEDQE